MMKVNLVMIVKNEERSLEHCLSAAAPYVDDIIIADTGSTDRSRDIAAAFGAHVYDFEWCDDFSAARNFALEKSDEDHEADINISLDADEYLDIKENTDPDTFRHALQHIVDRYGKRWIGQIHINSAFKESTEISHNISIASRILPSGIRYTGTIHEQIDSRESRVMTPLFIAHDGYLYPEKSERNLSYLFTAIENEPESPFYLYQLASDLGRLRRFDESLGFFRTFYQKTSTAKTKKLTFWKDGILRYLYTLYDIGTDDALEEAKDVMSKVQYDFSRNPDFFFYSGLFYSKLISTDNDNYNYLLPYVEKSYLKCLELGEKSREEGGIVGTGSFKAAYNLGYWYESSGDKEKAKEYYTLAARDDYSFAVKRLNAI